MLRRFIVILSMTVILMLMYLVVDKTPTNKEFLGFYLMYAGWMVLFSSIKFIVKDPKCKGTWV